MALLGTSGDVKEFEVGADLDQSSRVQAVCDWFGPTDFVQMAAHAPSGARLDHNAPDAPEARLIGGPVQENRDKAARANPITYASKDDAPFLIVHGDQDPTVPYHQSQLLFDALKLTGVSVHFHTIHGAGHGGPGFAGRNIDEMVNAFFDERLKDGVARVEALATESTADPAAMARDPRANAPGGPQRGIPWEMVAARDDKNKDGKVSKDEFSGPPALFDRLDRNHDGVLTKEESGDAPAAPARP